MKNRLFAALAALCLLLSLTACGGEEEPSDKENDRSDTSGTVQTEGPREPDTAEPAQTAPKTLAEAEIHLLACYTYNGTTFFSCAVQNPESHRLSCYLSVNGESSRAWILNGYANGWTIFYTDEKGIPEGEAALTDIQLTVTDYSDPDSTKVTIDSWGEPATPERYADYGIYPVGEHYALFPSGYITVWSNADEVDLTIQVPNAYLDGQEGYALEDLTPEMFSLYASDGTPLAEYIGVPAEGSVKATPYGAQYKVSFGESGGDLVRDALGDALRAAGVYYVYHAPDGTDHTVVCDFSK